tara:strand:- start:707 stop:1045 length:339 start_codon:yes stop_codon:yes gene_type:complete
MEKNNINKAKQVLDTLSEGRLADDLKKFKEEHSSAKNKLKEKAYKLRERQNQLKAVGLVNEKISTLVSELKNLPISEVLGSVKKSHSRKYEKAIGVLEGLLENTKMWMNENN